MNMKGMKDPINDYNIIEHGARDEVMKCGGSVSHHHGIFFYWFFLIYLGVGKIRKGFMERSIGKNGVNILK